MTARVRRHAPARIGQTVVYPFHLDFLALALSRTVRAQQGGHVKAVRALLLERYEHAEAGWTEAKSPELLRVVTCLRPEPKKDLVFQRSRHSCISK